MYTGLFILASKVTSYPSNNDEESIGNGLNVQRTTHFNVINTRVYVYICGAKRVHGLDVWLYILSSPIYLQYIP